MRSDGDKPAFSIPRYGDNARRHNIINPVKNNICVTISGQCRSDSRSIANIGSLEVSANAHNSLSRGKG
jgi:hypothetical protein